MIHTRNALVSVNLALDELSRTAYSVSVGWGDRKELDKQIHALLDVCMTLEALIPQLDLFLDCVDTNCNDAAIRLKKTFNKRIIA